MSQKGNAGRDLIQVGRDYFRYLQVNIEAGNWVVILSNLFLIFFVSGMVGLGAKTGVKEIQSRIQENSSIPPSITPYSPVPSPSPSPTPSSEASTESPQSSITPYSSVPSPSPSPTPSSEASTESPQSPSYTSELKPKPEDIELNARVVKGSDFSTFDGTVTNTSNIDVKEFSIKVKGTVSGWGIYPKEGSNLLPICQSLKGSQFVDNIGRVKNLKAGETRPIVLSFRYDEATFYFPKDFPEDYKNSPDLDKCGITLSYVSQYQLEVVDLN
ncbi:hypothetical protein [Phormidesmis priestleyi]|uniref:hypothetical protein n=1 Tax=Phormidesmis priestleyi TaxID=268141 RepID=UPI000B063458|nr:hypothetical protein [Phormidesmis priestleyi]